MREFWVLTKTLIKTSGQSFNDAKSKKLSTIALYALLAVCFLPMLYVLYDLFVYIFETVTLLHQQSAGLGLGFYLSSFVTFIFAMFMVPGIYYFSKDIQTLLYLPIKPHHILASKFSVMLAFEYLFSLLVILPMYVAYVQELGASIGFVVIGAICFLLLPIVPLLYASLIVILMMRFLPFAKNKDRFNMIFGTLGLLATLVVVYYFQYSSMNTLMSDTNFILGLLTGDSPLVNVFSAIFPTVAMMANALADQDFVQLGLFVAVIVVLMALFLVLGNRIYLKSAVNVSDSMSTGKKLSRASMRKQTVRKPAFFSYLKKELRLLIRNPIYFQNCVLISFLMPVLFFVPVLIGGEDMNFMETLADLRYFLDLAFTRYPNESYAFVILGGIGLGFFMSNTNMISATAISREGAHYDFMKYIPLSYMTQVAAKATSGIVISLAGGLLLVISAIIGLQMPLLASALLLLTFILGDVYGNFLGVLVDLLHPKLVWEQEASAVKQNFTAAIMMLSGFAFGGIIIFLGIRVGLEHVLELAIALLVILLVTSPLLYQLVKKQTNRLFAKL